MSYSVPFTAISSTAYTAAQHNQYVRDNILETPAAKFTAAGQLFVATGANAGAARQPTVATVATSATTGSATFADLATGAIGPTVSVVTGAMALVGIYCSVFSSGAFNSYMGIDITGATTRAVVDAMAFLAGTGANLRSGMTRLISGLTPGTNVFTAKYRCSSPTSTFLDRELWVLPL
jgi:hypothetical protein